jgi:electron transfer flavoprotein alpha subunit
MSTLLLAELSGKALSPATAKALSAAKDLGGDVHILVVGSDVKAAADAAAKLESVAKVLVADAPQLAHGLAEEVSALILSIALMSEICWTSSSAATRGAMFLPYADAGARMCVY